MNTCMRPNCPVCDSPDRAPLRQIDGFVGNPHGLAAPALSILCVPIMLSSCAPGDKHDMLACPDMAHHTEHSVVGPPPSAAPRADKSTPCGPDSHTVAHLLYRGIGTAVCRQRQASRLEMTWSNRHSIKGRPPHCHQSTLPRGEHTLKSCATDPPALQPAHSISRGYFKG